MQVLLLSTYDLGHQPFGLASPAAWLRSHAHQVTCADLSVTGLPEDVVRAAQLVAFYLPMHTAARLAVPVIETVRQLNPQAQICCYGLYGPLNAEYLRGLGVTTILGGEFEADLLALADGLPAQATPVAALPRLAFQVPDRTSLTALSSYSKLRSNGSAKVVGYTEATRGCKHICRHCPVVNVYQGSFRVVQSDIVLQDIRQQIERGAQHITFGDPDFWNAPTHALRIIESMHAEFPEVTYDATIKIEHLRLQSRLLPELKRTGCVFVTSAVESLDDNVLSMLDKGHTRQDFIDVVSDFREIGLALAPTFIAFTPWTTRASYREFLECLLELELVENVSPVQLALRLLIPSGSRLLELDDIRAVVQGFEAPALLHRWKHPDPAIDALAVASLKIAGKKASRSEIFAKVWELAQEKRLPDEYDLMPRATIPYMDEPWYC
ncbi:MAG: CUAEP/CCAEP-tail radical SAM protein [Acidobacteriota bacterium]|nr:CUAEP/CCAEP-tail radical SAM protein [Acidobacteriota bacterium]